jgi:prophage regulatory protein
MDEDAIRVPPLASPSVTRLIRLKEVQHRIGLGRSTIYRWMAEGRFPKSVQLGGYAVAWPEEAIETWIAARLAEYDDDPRT